MGISQAPSTGNYFKFFGSPGGDVWTGYTLDGVTTTLYDYSHKRFDWVPVLADDFPSPLIKESVDGIQYWTSEVKLKENAYWSDGEQITADDFVFVVQTALDMELGNNFYSVVDPDFLDHVEALSSHKIKVYFLTEDFDGEPMKPGMSIWQFGLAFTPILALHYWQPVVDEAIKAGDIEAQQLALFPHIPENEPTANGFVYEKSELGSFTQNVRADNCWRQGTKVYLQAVDDVSLQLQRGGSLGLVAESGCCKTTLSRLVLRLIEPTSGSITFHHSQNGPTDFAALKGRDLKAFRSEVQMVFQDPYQSINPRLTVLDAVAEPLLVQGVGNGSERRARVSEMLERVGMSPATSFLFKYPHQLSGGQRPRVAIARALVLGPDLVVADEPTSMRDVSVRAGVMKLMNTLRKDLGIACLFITHDLSTARYMCDRIAVMYMGKIVEIGETEELLSNPRHPYTKALLAAVPNPDPSYRRPEVEIGGSVSTPIDPVDRCRFSERCPMANDFCKAAPHPALETRTDGRMVSRYRV